MQQTNGYRKVTFPYRGGVALTSAARTAHDVCRRDVVDVAEELDTDLRHGLTAVEAAARVASDGPNTLDAAVQVPSWRKFLAQFVNPLVCLLLVAVVVSLVAWMLAGSEGLPLEAIVIVGIMVLNAVLGFVQEARAEQAVAALQQMTAASATVVRDGREQRVS